MNLHWTQLYSVTKHPLDFRAEASLSFDILVVEILHSLKAGKQLSRMIKPYTLDQIQLLYPELPS